MRVPPEMDIKKSSLKEAARRRASKNASAHPPKSTDSDVKLETVKEETK